MTRTWLPLVTVTALAGAMAITAAAHSEEPPPPSALIEKLVAVQPSLASRKDAPVDARELAEAIGSVTTSPQWAAFLLTTARHEAALSARIARGECLKHECDGGRAWGLFQNWKSAANADVWGSPDIRVQVKAASHLSRQYYNMCRGSGVPFPLSTFRALGGHGCTLPLKGEEQRMRTYQRVLARLQ